jgi:hypothetical protein
MNRRLLALIAIDALAAVSPAQADPISVAILTALGYTGAAGLLAPTAILLTLAGSALVSALPLILLTTAVVVASAFLSGAGKSSSRGVEPSPTDRQQTVRQSVGPRIKFYGRNKLGGTMSFFESNAGILYNQIMHNQGQISAILEYWLLDQLVTLDGSGYVNEAPYVGQLVRIEPKFGLPSQTAAATLIAAFPSIYTSEFQLNGIFNTLISYKEVPAASIGTTYPQGAPQLRVVADCSLVFRVRQNDFAYSNNPADCIYDYLVHPDGTGKDPALIDIQSFRDYADLCDELVARKGGGTLFRYRIATSYALNEEQRDVLPRLLSCCDAELYITAAGKIAIRGGEFIAPTVTIDATLGHIITANFRRGQGKLAAFNELTFLYTDPDQDYSEVEGQAWEDTTNIALRGYLISAQAVLYSTPSHAQARRLAKILTKKKNPAWIGTITTNLYGFAAIGEPTINVVFPELGISESFAVTSVRFLDDLTGVTLGVSSLGADAYAWDAETEEGTAPAIPDDTSSSSSLDPPTHINVSAAQRTVSGTVNGVFIVTTWDEPARQSLAQEVQHRESPAGAWLSDSVAPGDEKADSDLVNSGASYDIQVRTVSPGGAAGAWSPPITVVATASVTAPAIVTGVSAIPGSGQVSISWTLPATANVVGARVYRNTVNTFGTATAITTQYGSPSRPRTYLDTGLAAGTYYYWVVAINGSSIEATAVATGAQVVT